MKIAIMLLAVAGLANAVAIIPPVAYFITVSLAAFLANALIGLFAWIAIQGFAQKMYGGKSFFEVAKFFFSSIGKGLIALFSMGAAITVFQPIDAASALITGMIAAVISLALMFLSKYREQKAVETNKEKILKGMLAFSFLVLIITSISSMLAIETKIIYQKADFQPSASTGISMPSFAQESKTLADVSRAPSAPASSAQPNERQAMPVIQTKEEIWFFPQSNEECVIYADGIEVERIKPENKCYYPKQGTLEKIYCPHALKPWKQSSDYTLITSSGSCSQKYTARLTTSGFEVE